MNKLFTLALLAGIAGSASLVATQAKARATSNQQQK